MSTFALRLNPDKRHVRVGIVVALVAMLLPIAAAFSKERTWYKYENEFVVAYSNESERTVKKLLRELEYFRAAVLQFANIAPTGQVARPNVIIFRTSKEFHSFIGSSDIGGLAVSEHGALYMLLPAGANDTATRLTLRHEYTHLLVAQNNVAYPTWFNEGFAELMSATQFRDRNSVFSVGDAPGRLRSETVLTPWSEVLADNFNPHSFNDVGRASDSYLQSWALVHYFLLGNEGNNRKLLSQYFVRIGSGEDSLSAFEAVVGMSADEFGESVLTDYEMRFWLFDFRGDPIKSTYERSAITDEEFAIYVERFRGRAVLLN